MPFTQQELADMRAYDAEIDAEDVPSEDSNYIDSLLFGNLYAEKHQHRLEYQRRYRATHRVEIKQYKNEHAEKNKIACKKWREKKKYERAQESTIIHG